MGPADTTRAAFREINKSRWPLLSPMLDELLDLPAEQRETRLQGLAGQDTELLLDLRELLRREQAQHAADFLATPAPLGPLPGSQQAGQQVGVYTLEWMLGQGGMGSVWLASRTDGRYQGQVAIKFLSSGLLGQGDAGRFAREGQILARLAHPHIARLIDAGVSPEGQQPYLVLEYVDGQPIDQHCRMHGLDLRQRITLFLDVLAAVAHAQQRLILHRDLKPSNILVTAAGEAKLLDFGIAKLLAGDATQPMPTPATELTQRAGNAYTPLYAAPEQVQGDEVTTATDVYALGVLLYQLLSGAHPTEHHTGQHGDTPLERLRALVEVEPKRVSEALHEHAAMAAKTGAPGESNSAQTARQVRELRGDLDTIVAKALKKAPAERYAHAEALADDLRRWLHNEPISARPDTRLYRSAKFVRRHPWGVGASALATLGLATGFGLALWQTHEARHQREQAEGLIEFMLGDLRKKLEPVGRLDVLDAVGEKALAYYADQQLSRLDPDALGRRARALHLMGEVADTQGKLAEAERMFREAADSTAELLARYPKDTQRIFDHAQSVYWVGWVARRRGQLPEAETQWRRYLQLAQQLTQFEPGKLDWRLEEAYAHNNLGVLALETGNARESLQTFVAARKVWLGIAGEEASHNFDLANAYGWEADAQDALGEYAGALQSQQAKIEALRLQPGTGDRRQQYQLALAELSIGDLLLSEGKLGDSLQSFERAVAQLEALIKLDSNNLLWIQNWCLARIKADAARQAQPGSASNLVEPMLVARMDRLQVAQQQQSISQAKWFVVVRGRWLVQQLGPGAGSLTNALQEEASDYLAKVRRFVEAGNRLSRVQELVVAELELRLGDRLSSGSAQAQDSWRQASGRLKGIAESGDPYAKALLAHVLLRLAQTEKAQALADALEHSAFRHPLYSELRQHLAAKL
ncbi:MAG TPA: protein kinase [Ideonella sp.]|uniref:protein kinase domain-containing protein n=1 Tax=Ideonella sp. TaxID=1929293 RepID=UPI002C4552B6|nr:protein kinase [Ideonella sp.]HSI51818.1 protein kinase [Ideonella sp.]